MQIPYWPNKRVSITAHRVERRNNKLTIMLALLYTTEELESYGYGKWFMRDWIFLDLPF